MGQTADLEAKGSGFLTDPEIVRELQAVANGLHNLQAHIPSLARRLEAVAQHLEPRPESGGSPDRGEPGQSQQPLL